MPDKTDHEVLLEIWDLVNQGFEWALEDFNNPDTADTIHYKAQGKKDAYRVVLSTMRQRMEGLPLPRTRDEIGAGCPFCGDEPIQPRMPSPKDEKVTKLTPPGFF